ncbi:hypothetical protein [Flavobacterium sp. N3904]|uniref:hypothetical protein n=1 Tax=Flavobacterium sp. N3904 TaxID=2986835 RepID=UPI002224BADA|nr:hypothetical protein [Flavobacterium sp. N3904]
MKQELFIRNAILEIFNSDRELGLKAFAEHPRVNLTRIDMSIVNNRIKEQPFKIELKYQFTKDSKYISDYGKTFEKDFVNSLLIEKVRCLS